MRTQEGGILDGVVSEIQAQGGKALAIPTDVTRKEEVDSMVAEALKTFDKVDILVNNAADQPGEAVPEAGLRRSGMQC